MSKSTQSSLKAMTILLNVLGLLSVQGLQSHKVKTLKFRWMAKKTAFSIFLTITTSVQLIIFAYNGVHKLLLRRMGNYVMALLGINKWLSNFYTFDFNILDYSLYLR